MINAENTVFIIPYSRNEYSIKRLISTLIYTMYPEKPNIIIYNDSLKTININYDKIIILNNYCEINNIKVGCGGSRYYLLLKARELKYEYIFSIDDDIEFHECWWEEITKGITKNPDYDFYTCTVYDGIDKHLYNHGQNIIIKDFEFKRLQITTYNNDYHECITGCGTAKFFTKKIIDKINFTKEAYLGEDSILDYELIHLNARCLCINNAIIYHKPNKFSSIKIIDFRTNDKYINYINLFVNKCNLFQRDLVCKIYPEFKSKNNKDIMLGLYNKYLYEKKKNKIGINKESAVMILKDFYTICRKNKVSPFITCGTLLGYTRDNDFIDHDLDIDVGILSEQFNLNLIKELINNGFIFYHNFGLLKDSFEFSIIKYNIKLDVFIYYKLDDGCYNAVYDAINNNWGSNIHNMYIYYYPKEIFYGDLIEVNFKGIDIYIPKNYKDFIKYHYGDNYIDKVVKWDYRKDPKCVKFIGRKNKENLNEII